MSSIVQRLRTGRPMHVPRWTVVLAMKASWSFRAHVARNKSAPVVGESMLVLSVRTRSTSVLGEVKQAEQGD